MKVLLIVYDGKLQGAEDFYENKHKNSDLPAVNFTQMSDEEMRLGLWGANKMLLENYYKKQMDFVIHQTKDLYLNRNSTFRGFR